MSEKDRKLSRPAVPPEQKSNKSDRIEYSEPDRGSNITVTDTLKPVQPEKKPQKSKK